MVMHNTNKTPPTQQHDGRPLFDPFPSDADTPAPEPHHTIPMQCVLRRGPIRLMLILNGLHWIVSVTEVENSSSYHGYSPPITSLTIQDMLKSVLIALMRFVAPMFGYENSGPHTDVPLDPKSLLLIWDTGASYGLTPFQSDFIDYVACTITVRDVTEVNTIIGIGMTLHKCITSGRRE